MTSRLTHSASSRPFLLVLGILLIATALRAPFTGVPPLLDLIQRSFSLSTAAAGMLTTLPLLAFAVVSPFSPLAARRYGLERSLFAALCLIAAGVALRSAGMAWALYAGTGLIGVGIAMGNVLLPSLLKQNFPGRIVALTSAYVLTMGIAAAIGSAAVIPLSRLAGLGWQFALAALLVLPLASALVWLPQLRSGSAPAAAVGQIHGNEVWRSALAWQVTLFLGLNSFVYYIAVAWLPAILADSGYSPAQAGSLHGLLQLATALPGLVLAPLVRRFKDQRLAAFGVSVLSVAGFLGLLVLPGLAQAWVVLFGFGSGAGILLGLTFIGLRTTSAHQAAALSGMTQCVGYLLAATGPTLIGALHDATGGWTAGLAMCAVLCGIMAIFGLFAGRDMRIARAHRVPPAGKSAVASYLPGRDCALESGK